ncbi:MAG: hypothetical protein ACJAZQ_002070 [Cognaticolwellia sp.]|jgi:hypothetical protein
MLLKQYIHKVTLCCRKLTKQGQMIGPEDMTVWEQFYSLAA